MPRHQASVWLGAKLWEYGRSVAALGKTWILLLDLCLWRFPCSGSPHRKHPRKTYINVPFHGPCVKKRNIPVETLRRQYILTSDRSNQSWQPLKWTVMELKLKQSLRCSLWSGIMVPIPSRSRFHWCCTVSLRKTKTDAISSNISTQPSGAGGAVFTLKSD